MLLTIMGRGFAGDVQAESNIKINLTFLSGWDVTFKGDTIHISGEEIFRALKGTHSI